MTVLCVVLWVLNVLKSNSIQQQHLKQTSKNAYVSSKVNFLKFQTPYLFLFSNKMLVFRAGINKILVRIANREDLDQTASSGSALFVYACLAEN